MALRGACGADGALVPRVVVSSSRSLEIVLDFKLNFAEFSLRIPDQDSLSRVF